MSSQIKIALYYLLLKEESEAAQTFLLDERVSVYPNWIIYLFFLAVAFVTFLKVISPKSFSLIFESFFLGQRKQEYSDNQQAISRSTRILLINFALVSGCVIYLLLTGFSLNYTFWFSFAPILYVVFIYAALNFLSWLTEQQKRLREQKQLLIQCVVILGLMYTILFPLWLLRPDWNDTLVKILITVSLFVFFFRFVRSFKSGIENNVAWYYLILYFCSLELWPLLFLSRNITLS